MTQKKNLYNVTFQTASGIRSRMIEAENMWQAREKIKQSYAQTYLKGGVKIISTVKVR